MRTKREILWDFELRTAKSIYLRTGRKRQAGLKSPNGVMDLKERLVNLICGFKCGGGGAVSRVGDTDGGEDAV